MQIQLIRNATMRLTFHGHTILTDPYLGRKWSYQSLGGREQNPTAELPISAEKVIAGVEMVLVSHLHNDHFDPAAWEMLPKELPIFCQAGDEARIAEKGFTNITPVEGTAAWQGISITRTTGTHGTGTWGDQLNPVSGFVLRAENEPVVYWCGDTIWYEAVRELVSNVRPDVIITHSAGAELGDSGPIIMDAEQTIAVCRHAPDAVVVAIHFEALDHCLVSRAAMRAAGQRYGIEDSQLRIPADGETITL
jgi:L-ascorbate metabolism protein UlaG (beta-lactamase superfamily)